MDAIATVGLPGSGKSEAAKTAHIMGLNVVKGGDIIRKEVKKRGPELTDKNTSRVVTQLGEERGEEFLTEFSIEMIDKLGRRFVPISD